MTEVPVLSKKLKDIVRIKNTNTNTNTNTIKNIYLIKYAPKIWTQVTSFFKIYNNNKMLKQYFLKSF